MTLIPRTAIPLLHSESTIIYQLLFRFSGWTENVLEGSIVALIRALMRKEQLVGFFFSKFKSFFGAIFVHGFPLFDPHVNLDLGSRS